MLGGGGTGRAAGNKYEVMGSWGTGSKPEPYLNQVMTPCTKELSSSTKSVNIILPTAVGFC